jgi:ssDNA-binding Zn-finger/Zn-ribbon topoisomerase 1
MVHKILLVALSILLPGIFASCNEVPECNVTLGDSVIGLFTEKLGEYTKRADSLEAKCADSLTAKCSESGKQLRNVCYQMVILAYF